MNFIAELHPFIVHFPIALLSLYIVLEIITYFIKNETLNNITTWILLFGIITSVNAVLTGNQAEHLASSFLDSTMTLVEESIEEHEQFATYTLWYFLVLLVVRYFIIQKKKMNKIFKGVLIILALCGGILIFMTGISGGKLVYQFGIGTELFTK